MENEYRYFYMNMAYLSAGAPHGIRCNPVLRTDGKCICSPGKQLARFEDGAEVLVIRRNLRLADKRNNLR